MVCPQFRLDPGSGISALGTDLLWLLSFALEVPIFEGKGSIVGFFRGTCSLFAVFTGHSSHSIFLSGGFLPVQRGCGQFLGGIVAFVIWAKLLILWE